MHNVAPENMNARLQRLQEAEDTLHAITSGEVDALVVSGQHGDRIFTLEGAEHPYRMFIEQMHEGAATLTSGGMILYCNRRFADMLQAPLETVIGSSIYQYILQADQPKVEQLLREAILIAGKEELTLLDTSGNSMPVYFSASNLQIDGTEALCVVLSDLTEQKHNEELIAAGQRRLDEELLKANKLESIGILAGGLAHDLNNSLTAILGNIYLAKRSTGQDNELSRRLTEAEVACLQARDVTQQLLTFSKGGVPVKKTASIAQLLTDWANFAVSGSNVQCRFEIAEDLRAVEIDEGQMSRVINNLVINAQQAMPSGGTITIKAQNMAVGPDRKTEGLPLSDGQYVKISVVDSGTGISEAHRTKIFDPYFTTKQKGSGLGLSIAYSVVKSHSGYITVDPKLGAGATFDIYLPASEQALPAEKAAPQPLNTRALRVLVMDDQQAIRDVIGHILSETGGNEVEFADDGAQAVAIYTQAKKEGRPYDVVIMDLTIPGGMGGKEAIKKLLEIDPDAKAIVFSGYSNDPIMSEFKKYGFSGVIRKPFGVDELIDAVHSVVEDR